jgi:hypothetical protein
MGDGRTDFTLPTGHKIAEQSERKLAADGGKGVAVEEEEGGLAVKSSQPI